MDMESTDSSVVFAFELGFTLWFWIDLLFDVSWHGIRHHFCSKRKFQNVFDASIIALDTVQLLQSQLSHHSERSFISVFRLLRLARLARTARTLHLPGSEDLGAM